jgi:hypothetical protein
MDSECKCYHGSVLNIRVMISPGIGENHFHFKILIELVIH